MYIHIYIRSSPVHAVIKNYKKNSKIDILNQRVFFLNSVLTGTTLSASLSLTCSHPFGNENIVLGKKTNFISSLTKSWNVRDSIKVSENECFAMGFKIQN